MNEPEIDARFAEFFVSPEDAAATIELVTRWTHRAGELDNYARDLERNDGGSTRDSRDARNAAEDYRREIAILRECGTIEAYNAYKRNQDSLG